MGWTRLRRALRGLDVVFQSVKSGKIDIANDGVRPIAQSRHSLWATRRYRKL